MPYAERTEVSPEKSKVDIERMVTNAGAKKFMQGSDEDKAMIMFVMNERHIRFVVQFPDRSDNEIAKDHNGYSRTAAQREKKYQQIVRSRWRGLFLVIKAKLTSIESGIAEFEDEFMAHIVLPDGQTVGDHMKPQIATAYETGTMPPLLPLLEDKS